VQISNIKRLKRSILDFYEGMEFNPSALPFPDDTDGQCVSDGLTDGRTD
jgi:hypothetical protein